jgi:hypothetical protein
MKLTYTLTLADFEAAQQLHIRQKLGRRIKFIIFYRAIPILTAALWIASIVFVLIGERKPLEALIPFDAGLPIMAIGLPICRYYNMRKCFKQLFPPTRTDRSSSIDIDEDRIFSAVPGVSEGKYFWTGVLAFAQDEKVTMLYIAETRFLFFPTSALSPEQRTELNDLVARHVTKRKP